MLKNSKAKQLNKLTLQATNLYIKPFLNWYFMEIKFNCNRSGCCCKNIRRHNNFQKDLFDKQNESGPWYNLINPNDLGVVVYSFEKDMLLELAKKNNLKISFSPHNVIIDEEQKKVLVIRYMMDQDTCPFLDKKDMCCIFDSNAFICRLYPLGLDTDQKTRRIHYFGCPGISDSKRKEDNEKVFKTRGSYLTHMVDYFGYDIVTASEMERNVFDKITAVVKYFSDEKNNPYFRAIKKPLTSVRQNLKDFEFIDFHTFIKSNPSFSEDTKKIVTFPSNEEFTTFALSIKKEIEESKEN